MNYREFLNTTTKPWLLADGGGGTKLQPGCAKQTPGSPALLYLNPGGKPYMDAYWYLTFGPQQISRDIRASIHSRFPTKKDLNASQGQEHETDWISSGVHNDTGIQADYNTGFWRTFDNPTRHWVASKHGLPKSDVWLTGVDVVSVCSVVPESFLGMVASFIRYEGLLVNGVWLPLGITSKSNKVVQADHFNFSPCQLDGNVHGDAYSCEVWQADLRIL